MELTQLLDHNLAIAGVFAVAAAMLRGFTGFGANLIWGPVLIFLWGPVEAVAIMGLTGISASLQGCIPEIRKADWPEITPIIIAATIGGPMGVGLGTLLHEGRAASDLAVVLCAAVVADLFQLVRQLAHVGRLRREHTLTLSNRKIAENSRRR